MKLLVIGFIVAIAGFMGWLWFQEECRGGVVLANEEECAAVQGFDRRFCSFAFARPEESILRSGNTFPTRDACLARHTNCIEISVAGGYNGFAAKPSGYCIAKGARGAIARITPVYRGP